MQNNIAVLSDKSEHYIFKSIGADMHFVETREDAESVLKALTIKYSLIFVSDSLTGVLKESLKKYEDLVYPIVMVIPSTEKDSGFALSEIANRAKESLGIDVFKE